MKVLDGYVIWGRDVLQVWLDVSQSILWVVIFFSCQRNMSFVFELEGQQVFVVFDGLVDFVGLQMFGDLYCRFFGREVLVLFFLVWEYNFGLLVGVFFIN